MLSGGKLMVCLGPFFRGAKGYSARRVFSPRLSLFLSIHEPLSFLPFRSEFGLICFILLVLCLIGKESSLERAQTPAASMSLVPSSRSSIPPPAIDPALESQAAPSPAPSRVASPRLEENDAHPPSPGPVDAPSPQDKVSAASGAKYVSRILFFC